MKMQIRPKCNQSARLPKTNSEQRRIGKTSMKHCSAAYRHPECTENRFFCPLSDVIGVEASGLNLGLNSIVQIEWIRAKSDFYDFKAIALFSPNRPNRASSLTSIVENATRPRLSVLVHTHRTRYTAPSSFGCLTMPIVTKKRPQWDAPSIRIDRVHKSNKTRNQSKCKCCHCQRIA